MPAEISLPTRQRLVYQFRVQRFEKVGSFDIERFERRQTDLGEIRFPAERRAERGQLLDRHFVVQLWRIAPFHAG